MSRGAPNGFSGCGIPALPSWLSTIFHRIVVEVMTSGLSLVCKLWFGLSKGHAPCKTSISKYHYGSQFLWAPTSLNVGVGGTCLP